MSTRRHVLNRTTPDQLSAQVSAYLGAERGLRIVNLDAVLKSCKRRGRALIVDGDGRAIDTVAHLDYVMCDGRIH